MKFGRKYILPAILICCYSADLLSQTPQQNLTKYWEYRTRLFEKFIVDKDWWFSPRGGINIPAGIYNPGNYGTRPKTVSWGDSELHISHYLGSMATEYQLLKLQNVDVTNVKTKLHRGLMAVERLDWLPEEYYGCGFYDLVCDDFQYTNKNGFFFRDDMDQFSFEYYGNNDLVAWEGLVLKSDYDNMDNDDGNQMSQDMFWHLLVGYSLITHFLEENDSELYPGYDCAQLNLRYRAIFQVYLMHRYMQSVTNEDDWDFQPIGVEYPGKWPYYGILNGDLKVYRIKNPCTGETVPRGGGVADLEPFAKYFRDASYVVTQGEFGPLQYASYAYLPDPVVLTFPERNHFFNNVGRLITSAISNNYYASDLDELFNKSSSQQSYEVLKQLKLL